MEELCDVGHDGLLIRTLDIHILGVKKLGNSKLTVRDNEGGFQSDFVAHMAHGLNVDQTCKTEWINNCLLVYLEFKSMQRISTKLAHGFDAIIKFLSLGYV